MNKRINWCMFGADKHGANKGVIVGYNKKFGAWTCGIYQLKESIKYGDRWCNDNVESEIFNLCFCDMRSLDGFIKILMNMKTRWIEKNNKGDAEYE